MRYIILILLILNSFITFGQIKTDTIESRCQTVIAIRGLNIRAKPDKTSKILGKVPFGEQIKYLSKQSFGSDTILDYKSLYSSYLVTNKEFKFVGNWAKINYKGTIGFVLDCYLFYDTKKDLKNDNNENFALLYPYSACYTNIYQPNKFNWYGMYRDKAGKYSLRKVNINYFSVYNENFGGKDFGVAADNNNGLILIIGTKEILKEGERKCIDLVSMKFDNDRTYNEDEMKLYGIEKVNVTKDNPVGYYVIKSGSKVQEIKITVKGREAYPINQIEFIGDIDGDNKLDYILSSEAEEGYNVLFLSSMKKKNNIVEPVAYFYTCYCC